jgi:hypothetical protein
MQVTGVRDVISRILFQPPLANVWAVLTCVVSLPLTAFELWSGPVAGWAAPVYSFFGSLAFWDWVWSGAPASRGPHDPDIGRHEMCASAAGFVASLLFLGGLISGAVGAQRLARILGRAALCLGLASVVLLMMGPKTFQLREGGYLWLGAMAFLAFSRVRGTREATRQAMVSRSQETRGDLPQLSEERLRR